MKRRKKICLVGLFCYPLFNPENKSYFGGAEVRVSLIAKGLAQFYDYDIHLIVFDHGQPDVEIREGVKLVKWKGKNSPLLSVATHDINTTSGKSNIIAAFRRFSKREFQRFMGMTRNKVVKGGLKYFYELLLTVNYIARTIANFTDKFGKVGIHVISNDNVQIFDDVDAEIYILPGNNELAADIAYYCKERKKNYVFLGSSDDDYMTAKLKRPFQKGAFGNYRFLMEYAITNASAHIVQNQNQLEILAHDHNIEGTLIKNPVDLNSIFQNGERDIDVLWIGKSSHVKRPEIFLDLVKSLPEYRFTMILNYLDMGIHNKCLQHAEALDNIQLIEYVPYNEIEYYYGHTRILVNTSLFEGFSNAFLQSAKYEAPVLSMLADPDGMLSKHGCGIVSGEEKEALVKNVTMLLSNDLMYKQMGEQCRNYIKEYHNKDIIIPKYRELLDSMMTSP